jgi:hypothetical protein
MPYDPIFYTKENGRPGVHFVQESTWGYDTTSEPGWTIHVRSGQKIRGCYPDGRTENQKRGLPRDSITEAGWFQLNRANINLKFAGEHDGLYIHGGRRSIVQWLRNHGNRPKILLENTAGNLYLYCFRKHRILGENSSLVLITRGLTPNMVLGGWQGQDPINVRHCVGSDGRPKISPENLATTLERMFAGNLLEVQ